MGKTDSAWNALLINSRSFQSPILPVLNLVLECTKFSTSGSQLYSLEYLLCIAEVVGTASSSNDEGNEWRGFRSKTVITHRRTTHEGLKVPPNATDGLVVSYILYGTTYSEYAKFRSVPPLFLEDEDIFQKSASVVPILLQFRVEPRKPIFDLQL